jgi:hypothetical protein
VPATLDHPRLDDPPLAPATYQRQKLRAFRRAELTKGSRDTGQSARLGDQITEYVTIAGIRGSSTWTVVEHDRPHHLALETDLAFGHLRISYQLATVDGGRTRFQRDLDFPDLGPQVNAVMEAQSAEGIASLARLVHRLSLG